MRAHADFLPADAAGVARHAIEFLAFAGLRHSKKYNLKCRRAPTSGFTKSRRGLKERRERQERAEPEAQEKWGGENEEVFYGFEFFRHAFVI